MTTSTVMPVIILGDVLAEGRSRHLAVVRTQPHSLTVRFDDDDLPDHGTVFDECRLEVSGQSHTLGRCRFESEVLEEQAHGRLIFLSGVYDLTALAKGGAPVDLGQKFSQVALLLAYKKNIRDEFRHYTADLVYDIQIHRLIFDEIDRALEHESGQTREMVRRQVLETEGRRFLAFLDGKLAELEAVVAPYSKLERERHGFYLRKQIWDILMTSEFLARTNLRPRGYAGDSRMMQQIYENEYQGDTLFGALMHKHPIESAAAQAVRNRRTLIPNELRRAWRERSERLGGAATPLRFLSVACGPAWELRDVFLEPEDASRFHPVLLDQDDEALAEAQSGIAAREVSLGVPITTKLIRDSVRTMLRTVKLSERWGKFDFIYTMGLFDYLTRPVAKAVAEKLYELLLPGGALIVGNFHVGNPTRHYMELWMDWVLIYRTEEELLELAQGCAEASCDVQLEATRSQMFLTVRKPR